MAGKDKMKRDEVKKLLTEAKTRRLLTTIIFTDDQTEWKTSAGVLVDESNNSGIELDPPTIEVDLCIAALGQGWPQEKHEVSFYLTDELDIDRILDKILSSILLVKVQEFGSLFQAPLGGIRLIRSC